MFANALGHARARTLTHTCARAHTHALTGKSFVLSLTNGNFGSKDSARCSSIRGPPQGHRTRWLCPGDPTLLGLPPRPDQSPQRAWRSWQPAETKQAGVGLELGCKGEQVRGHDVGTKGPSAPAGTSVQGTKPQAPSPLPEHWEKPDTGQGTRLSPDLDSRPDTAPPATSVHAGDGVKSSIQTEEQEGQGTVPGLSFRLSDLHPPLPANRPCNCAKQRHDLPISQMTRRRLQELALPLSVRI